MIDEAKDVPPAPDQLLGEPLQEDPPLPVSDQQKT
jgi:hypothetical protein